MSDGRNKMEMKEAKRRVALFKVADGSDSDAVSDILARLLVAGSLSMGELQTSHFIIFQNVSHRSPMGLYLSS